MSSSLENIKKILTKSTAMDQRLRIATPFTKMMTMGGVSVDMSSDEIAHEMWKGNRKASPMVSRKTGGYDEDSLVIRPGVIGANDYLLGLTMQKFEIPSLTLNKRVPGELPFDPGMTSDSIKLERRRILTMIAAKDAIRRILTRNEILAKQVYFDAEMDLGERFQGEMKIVYPRSASLKNRTVGVSWATAASAKPWDDYGAGQREIKKLSQVETGALWHSFLSSDTMGNLEAVYRNQRPNEGPGANMVFNDFDFNPDKGAPSSLSYLVDNGCEYNGWIRTSYSNSKVHLFTLPEGYDATADDSAETYTDWIAGETVSIALSDPSFHKAYYGPGILEPPQNNIVENAVGRVGIPKIGTSGNLTLGNSGVPAESMLLNIYQLGQSQGFGGAIENGMLYAPRWADTIATIKTETTA